MKGSHFFFFCLLLNVNVGTNFGTEILALTKVPPQQINFFIPFILPRYYLTMKVISHGNLPASDYQAFILDL